MGKQDSLLMELGEFEYFADFFFDGLIFDWVVQTKISKSLARATQVKLNIYQVVTELEDRKELFENKMEELLEKREQLIESAGL